MSVCSSDDVFGPVVDGCRGGFDFTLLFEQSILSIGPSAIFLLFVPVKFFQLLRANIKTLPNRSFTLKAVRMSLSTTRFPTYPPCCSSSHSFSLVLSLLCL